MVQKKGYTTRGVIKLPLGNARNSREKFVKYVLLGS